uniref:Uncharacterized protein n=1 Tax=Skeletonema marinoi TaxID=267567 RepID=A0A7S2MAP5_9STRA|mmetsp:Transcript_6688/g.11252  ORF Transcript_6688/g.11252 Transcript_6688/m.11252 type:complete len:151 (+) Transcript_6688:289-741(+)
MYQRYNNNTMHQTQTTIIIFIILVSSLLNSHAWGPVTHLYLCSLADNETTTAINRFQLLTSAEHALLRIQPSSLYKFELQRHSFCNNVSNYQEVVTNFNLSADWAVSTCILWRRTMWTLIKRGDLKEAAPTIHREVNELFQANNGTSCVI